MPDWDFEVGDIVRLKAGWAPQIVQAVAGDRASGPLTRERAQP